MIDNVSGIPFEASCQTRYSPVYQRPIEQCTVVIPGGGCAYFRACKGDVCPFCAFPIFSRFIIKGPDFENHYQPWTLDSHIYEEMYRRSFVEINKAEKLAIFNGGSFFPTSELPEAFQHFVYEDVASRDHITQLMVESYPNFITKRKLLTAKEILGTTDFKVAIGFETVNDSLRNNVLKKRINKSLFEQKVKLLKSLDIQVFIYAFLKAPGLSEGEALQETLATIEYLHDLGVDEIALSCAFVPPDTPLETQYQKGEFRPPWLWSIIQIMDIANERGWPLSVGGFEDNPKPIAGPQNCEKCTDTVLVDIENYRRTGKYSPNIHMCECKNEWTSECATPTARIMVNNIQAKGA